MRTEMDAMGLDERQRLAWLQANRATLLILGLIWIGMIAYEWFQGRTPLFLIVMVPVIAAVRFGLFLYFSRTGHPSE